MWNQSYDPAHVGAVDDRRATSGWSRFGAAAKRKVKADYRGRYRLDRPNKVSFLSYRMPAGDGGQGHR